MSLAATPPTPRRRSRLWYVAVFGLVGVLGLAGLLGGLHWYTQYARSLGPSGTPSVLHYPEKEPGKPKTEKASSGDKSGGTAKAGTDSQADSPEKVSSHKSTAKPTATPGA